VLSTGGSVASLKKFTNGNEKNPIRAFGKLFGLEILKLCVVNEIKEKFDFLLDLIRFEKE
jgi:hypothetical protein